MEKLTLPPGVTHRHDPDVDIVAWTTKRDSLAWDNLLGLSVGAIFIVGVLLFFTRLLFSDSPKTSDKTFGDWVVILIFYGIVWFMVVGFLYAFQSITWIEEIRISDTDIVVTRSGRYAPKKKLRFHKNTVFRLALDNAPEDGHGLCIFYKNPGSVVNNQPKQLATWMREDNKYQLLRLLHQILDMRGWQIAHNMIYGRSKPIDITALPPSSNPLPENKPVEFSQRAIDFVVHELGMRSNHNDIIIKLCQLSGCYWDQASALVARFESIMFAQKTFPGKDEWA